MKRARLLLAAVVAIVGFVLLARATVRILGSSLPANAELIDDVVDAELVKGVKAPSDAEVAPVLDSVRTRATADLKLRQYAGVSDAAVKTVRAYLDPDPAAFQSVLQQQGVAPPPIAASDPESWRELWGQAQALVAHARFDTARISWRRADESAPVLTSAASVRVGRRDGARAFLDALAPRDRIAAELILPGSFTAQDGSTFEGALSLRFVKDPSVDRWVLVQLALEGVPNEVTALMPPL